MQTLLYNRDFLLKLDKSKNKTIYARITALQFNESPIETIEGRVTGGSINIDGSSALRRSCSLTIVAQDFNYNDYYWGLKTKFKLEIGVENFVDSTMPNIIWFNQGIYLITSFNTSHSVNNFTISISGKDKMCLLNGEIGGSLESSIDFGTIEEEDDNGIWTIRSLPISEIIRNAVHTYAGEPYWNIIINDLDTQGLELLEYRYDTPMYFYRPFDENNDNSNFLNIIMENDNLDVYPAINENEYENNPKKLKDLTAKNLDLLVDSLTEPHDVLPVKVNGKEYIFAKVEYGQTAGYRITDLVYAGDLIANVGDSITSVLDKIKNMLTEFEYFYDVDGHFVFQKKKSFTSTIWSPLGKESDESKLKESLMVSSADIYTFSGGELVINFNNNPNLTNLRNDYSIWGERKGVSGASIPIHMRYAIDNKPKKYKQIFVEDGNSEVEAYNKKYNTSLPFQTDPKTFEVKPEKEEEAWDWREIIYQMAKDYYRYNFLEDFELRLIKANPEYYTGQTGYENYYIDLQGFWRQLYNPDLANQIKDIEDKIKDIEDKIENCDDKDKLDDLKSQLESYKTTKENYKTTKENYYDDGDKKYWNKDVYERPDILNFWFDFLDAEGELQQFNVKNVGARPKSINDTAIKSIYFRETPAAIFTNNINEGSGSAYRYIQIPEEQIDEMFSISGQGKSAKDKLDELIYQHGYCVENVNITTIPVYYLEPNTRIQLYDKDSGLNGEYIVDKITLPLTYNGTMTITATKAAQAYY